VNAELVAVKEYAAILSAAKSELLSTRSSPASEVIGYWLLLRIAAAFEALMLPR